ncbi:MAG TPA: VOC family protein [Pseudonocardiaceae bacterium]|jgi:hypothetical protein|nr:VOC family protein [Pseudonocardiaceae bacterium]
MAATAELAALVIDCADPEPIAAFYQLACGGEIIHRDADSAWVTVGAMTVIFRQVAGYRPPTWPAEDVPVQLHFDFFVDDLTAAQARLCEYGATVAEYQPGRADGLLVLLDPAGHPFCIAARQQQAAAE